MLRKIITAIFFSNAFYGLCAVALAMETALQLAIGFNSGFFYVFLFSVTAFYYTKAYITEKKTASNPRSAWYARHHKKIRISQVVLFLVAAVYGMMLLFHRASFLQSLHWYHWFAFLIFPAVAALYYGISLPSVTKYTLRNIGWLKPFVIGFVWGGLVTIYPVLFYNIEQQQLFLPDFSGIYLFVKNFMFITVLCIMFDIKDYAADHNRQLKTFVVNAGLRVTIFFILIPLCVAGLGSFVYYGIARDFSTPRILLNVIPFLCLIAVAYSMHRRKSILYYLIVIDGLMLVKAVIGALAVLYF